MVDPEQVREGPFRAPTSTSRWNAELDALPVGLVRSSLIATAYGRVYTLGAGLAGLWMVLQHGSAANPTLVAPVVAVFFAMGLLLLSPRGAGLPLAALQRLGLTANAAVSLAWLGAGPGNAEFAMFYVWATPLGLVFARCSVALSNALVAIAGATGVLAWQSWSAGWSSSSLMEAVATWVLVAGGVAGVSLSVRWAAQLASVADHRILRSLSASSTGVAVMTPEGVITEANQALAAFFEATTGGLIGRHAGELTHPEDVDATEELFAELRRRYVAGEPAAAAIEKRCLTVHGNVRWSTVRAIMLDGADGKPFVFTQVIDITDRVEAARSAERSSRIERQRHDRQRVVADFTKRALTSGSLDDVADDAVKLLTDVLGVPLANVLQPNGDASDLMLASGVGWSPGLVRRTMVPSSPCFIDGYTLRIDDLVAMADQRTEGRFSASPLLHSHGVVSGMCGPIRGPEGPYGVLGVYALEPRTFDTHDQMLLQQVADIIGAVTARARSERALAHHAMHDHLTGLPNRYLFHDRLSQHLGSKTTKDSDGSHVCVLLLDLDHFKLVNETLGHPAGDELLTAVAPRLRETAGGGATIARLGGDEFAVLIDNTKGDVNPLAVARHLLSRISEPVTLALSHTIHVTASIGVAFGSVVHRRQGRYCVRQTPRCTVPRRPVGTVSNSSMRCFTHAPPPA